jgi:hypothetical protein
LDTSKSYQLFSNNNPEASVLLSNVEAVPDLEVCETVLQEPNLKDTRKGEARFVYSEGGAYSAAFEWRQQFHLFKVDVLYVFGIGLGWEWMALEPWLNGDPKKEVIFLEDDLSMFYRFLEMPWAEKILSHPQTSVYYIDGQEIGKRVFELLAWNSYRKKTLLVATRYYEKYRAQTRDKLDKKIQVQLSELSGTLNEFYSFGQVQFRCFFRNIFSFARAKMGSDLFHSFSQIPIIVVAAGPSLEGCLEELRNIGDKAIIISGGTATNILLEAGIRPHLCAAVDPNATQYHRLKQIQPFAIPLFYQSRILPEGIKDYKGDLLYLRGGNGQPLIEWFDKALGISGKIIDGGHSVSNMIIEIAYHMGCSPILMVGYDLSYPAGKMYPSFFKEALSSHERLTAKEERVGNCSAKSNSGSEVRTEDMWIVEATWIHQFVLDHPEMKIYNTSQSGMAIPSVPFESFHSLRERFLNQSHSVDARVQTAITNAEKIPFSMEKISKAFSVLAKSIKECESILQVMRKAPNPLLEYEINEQIAFRFFLSIYCKMFEKRIDMCRIFEELHLQDPERRDAFEQQMYDEKIQFFTDGLKHLSRRVCECVGLASYEGYFFQNSDDIRALEILEEPNFLKKKS